jgi:hypothetical protein
MKRKAKRYDEGGNVKTRSDKEFEEDSKYGGYGRYMPKTKEYTVDEVKEKLSGMFGGKKEDTSKFDELESVKKTKTLAEQIGRKADTEEPRRKFSDYNKTDKASTVSEEDAPYKVEKTTPPKKEKRKEEVYPGPNDKRKTQPESTLPKKNVGEDAKPLPGVQKDRAKPQNLPAKPERKKEPTPYKDVVKSEDVGSQSFASKDEKKESGAKTRAGTTARTPEIKTGVARTRAGTVVKSSDEPSAEAKTKAMSSLAAKIKKQDEENRFNFSPSKSPNRSYKSGGSVSSASSRADGIAQRGKTRGKIY